MALIVNPQGPIVAGLSNRFRSETMAELVDEVNATGRDGVAKARWDFSYGPNPSAPSSEVDLTMDLSIAMPEWINASKRPEAERTEWTRFMNALREHEDGHIEICRREAPAMFRRMAGNLRTLEAVFQQEKRRIKQLNDSYDTRTNHGLRQNGRHGNTIIVAP